MNTTHLKPLVAALAVIGASLTQTSALQAVETRGGPAGIYSLGSAQAGFDAGQVFDESFIAGHTARVRWEDLNPSDGEYHFDGLDDLVKALEAAGQRLNLEVMALSVPQWLLDDPGVETYLHFNDKFGTQPVPWDAHALGNLEELWQNLSTHSVELGDSGVLVPFAEHPVLESVVAPVLGLSSFRDDGTLTQVPGYDRQLFLDAARDSILASRNAFPDKHGFAGFFSMRDDGQDAGFGAASLADSVLEMLDENFDGPDGPLPTLGLFMENLSDNGPNANSRIADAIEQLDTFLMLQALSAWTAPFNPDHVDKVTSMNPATGIDLAYNELGVTFFEIYAADINNALAGFVDADGNLILDDLIYWNQVLTGATVPEPSGNMLCGLAMLALAMWRTRSGSLERSSLSPD